MRWARGRGPAFLNKSRKIAVMLQQWSRLTSVKLLSLFELIAVKRRFGSFSGFSRLYAQTIDYANSANALPWVIHHKLPMITYYIPYYIYLLYTYYIPYFVKNNDMFWFVLSSRFLKRLERRLIASFYGVAIILWSVFITHDNFSVQKHLLELVLNNDSGNFSSILNVLIL